MVCARGIVWPTMLLPFFKARNVGVRIIFRQLRRLGVLKRVVDLEKISAEIHRRAYSGTSL